MYSKIAEAKKKELFKKYAGPLTNVSHLRYQAVFTMGAAGSGKSFVANNKWLNHLPDPSGNPAKYKDSKAWDKRVKESISQMSRGLTNIDFEAAQDNIFENYNIKIEPGNGTASLPFRLYEYDGPKAIEIPKSEWRERLPPKVFQEVEGLTEVVFSSPTRELPSYWRQVNPDLYKEELAGYLEAQPGYVHEMSSKMSKSYFEAAILTGDPVVVDGTGSNLGKMKKQIQAAHDNGYRVTLVWIYVPLTINMIRNADRARKVEPHIIVDQFKEIRKNFNILSSMVFKADYVDNRFDKRDKGIWKSQCDEINEFILKETGFPSLYEYMLSTPYASEVKGPYKWVQYCGKNPILEEEEYYDGLRDKRDRLLGRKASLELVLGKHLNRKGNIMSIANAKRVALRYTQSIRKANFSKRAQRPYMPEVNARANVEGLAFMAYMIDGARNNSKFYEMAITPHIDGSATLTKMWGALGKGKTRSKVEEYADLEQAMRVLDKQGKAKLRKGYEDAFRSQPKGQYPIGLDRSGPGFGWGTQDIRTQIKALKQIEVDLEEALGALASRDNADLIQNLTEMRDTLSLLEDGMAKEMRKLIITPLNHLRGGEFNERLVRKYLTTLKNYLRGQLKHH